MPAIAANDNETLDHLLSVVDDSRNLAGIRRLSKRHRGDVESHNANVLDGTGNFLNLQQGRQGQRIIKGVLRYSF